MSEHNHDQHIFPHKCNSPECETIVQYDDEPWCFVHSPPAGSFLPGYSAKRAAGQKDEQKDNSAVSHNIFEQTDS